jgi:N-acetylneuraminic acid mutarotase
MFVLILASLLSRASVSLAVEDTWTMKTDMPTARYDFSTSVVNGKIYAIGGGTSFYTKSGLKTVEEYDPLTDTWTRKTDMPTGRQALSTSVVNGKIYAIGGIVSPPGYGLATVEEYNPATDTWIKKGDMPTARAGLATTAVNGKIYAIGGVAYGPGAGMSTVEEYDPVTDTWMRKSDMPTPRHFPGISVVDGKIYVIGGIRHCDYTSSLSIVEEYDPVTDTWTTKTSMPTARTALSASVVDGNIYAIGGAQSYKSTATIFPIVEEYDPATDSWMSRTEMPTARQSLSTSIVNGKIYAIGGSTAPFPWSRTAIVEEYDAIASGPDSTWGSGSTAAINDYQFAGIATLNIRGQEKSADLLVTLLAEPEVEPNGVQHVLATHTFTFADGSSFATSDQEVATPTATPGLYTLTGIMDLISGTGMYEGVTGRLTVNGTIDFAAQPPAAQFDIGGAIIENTTGSGATAAINDYQFAGTATLTTHGQEISADLLVTLLEPPVVDVNGVQYVKATHQFTFADGSSFTTSDQEVATPTPTPGLYTLTGIMDIASGTGIYGGVTGRLAVNGTIDFAAQPPAAQFDIAGAVIENTTGSGATTAISDNQFAGTAKLTIHGQEKSADLLVTLLAEPEVEPNGVQHVLATHTFTFADDSSFTTSDQEIATPTCTLGLYILTGIMDLASGTGMYEGVTGRLAVNGTIDFAAQPPVAQFDIFGAVAYCGDVNHPYPVGDMNQDCNVNVMDFALMASHWLDCTYPNSD